jgi:hypothetical protein
MNVYWTMTYRVDTETSSNVLLAQLKDVVTMVVRNGHEWTTKAAELFPVKETRRQKKKTVKKCNVEDFQLLMDDPVAVVFQVSTTLRSAVGMLQYHSVCEYLFVNNWCINDWFVVVWCGVVWCGVVSVPHV